jgi:iron complex transport system permease protein
LHSSAKLLIKYSLGLLLLCSLFVLPPSFEFNSLELHILWQFKLPTLLTALLVGACIASASACLQVLLNNPLADPGIIGISSGASLMAASFILLAGTPIGIAVGLDSVNKEGINLLPVLCFVGAFISSLLIFTMARWMGGAVSTVILAGIAISTMCSAIIGWMFLIAPARQLQSLTFWLMGSFNNTNWQSLTVALPIAGICLTLLFLRQSRFNLLYLGEQSAQLAGLNTKRFQTTSLLLISVLVGLSVSIAGSIAFLGLLVPHFIRRMYGNDNTLVAPLAAIVGASVMVLCALINEQLSSVSLPISILTASIGAPLFIYVMLKNQVSTA